MTSETAVFDPEAIRTLLDRDLVAGLRAVADAIAAGSMDGRFLGFQGVGGRRGDDRAHVLVTLDLAAAVVSVRESRCELGSGVAELGKVELG